MRLSLFFLNLQKPWSACCLAKLPTTRASRVPALRGDVGDGVGSDHHNTVLDKSVDLWTLPSPQSFLASSNPQYSTRQTGHWIAQAS